MRSSARGRLDRWPAPILPLLLSALVTGCAAREVPEALKFDAAQYEAVFDAAVEAAREAGMPPALRDRRSGVIETEPRIAGSLFEPWRGDNSSLGQATENTLAFQRRRARFEFSMVGFEDRAVAPGDFDLTQVQGELALRVWVFVERAHSPGLRRSTWSRQLTTTTDLIAPERQEGRPEGTFWTVMTRDPAYEQGLLRAVQKRSSAARPADFQ